MSRWLDILLDGSTKEEIESMDICKWKINEVCCNADCEEYVADYPYPFCECSSKEDCKYFEEEDGIIKKNKKEILNVEINGKLSDISAMLLSAERYALGRQTYIVEWTCSFISKNLHLLTEGDRKVMIRDIEECENYGMTCDKKEWMKLLQVLKEGNVNDR